MLEDNLDRIERFKSTLRILSPNLTLHVWRDANAMIREVGLLLPQATLISLDHDLQAEPGMDDPGDGLMVVKHLVTLPIIRPVIIHSSNTTRATWMAGEFDLGGWTHWRVAPIGDDWIETDWRSTAETILSVQHIEKK